MFILFARAAAVLGLCVGVANTAIAADPTPQIIYNGKPILFVVQPYIGANGQLYAPVDFFRLTGASYVPNPTAERVVVILASGRRTVADYTNVNGRCCVAIGAVADALGGTSRWDPTGRKLTVLGKLVSVTASAGKLDIKTSFQTTCLLGRLADPPRIYVDVSNTDAAAGSAAVDNETATAIKVRTGQVSPTVARIVLDLKQATDCTLVTTTQADHLEVALGNSGDMNPSSQVASSASGGDNTKDQQDSTETFETPTPVVPPVTARSGSGPNALAQGVIPIIPVRPGDTVQTPVASMQPNDLTGQIVAIDPGHGADDSGAVGINGLREKDLTLAIGLKLRNVLQSAGATVYMTRDTDIKPSVTERPLMAIAWHANYFISIHCDKCGDLNSHSGTTVYFHAQNTVCELLAHYISGRVGEASGIPALGIKSDTIRFQSGFGVLRGSPMPAVLVECGYVNDAADVSKLTESSVQQKIAQGIAAGLRDFVANQRTHQ